MKLKSFGCSFIYGSDLSDCPHGTGSDHPGPSQLTWPALIAHKLGMDYSCYAWPGTGNLRILERILYESCQHTHDLYVISWTWIDRFDYLAHDRHPWQPWAWRSIMPGDSEKFALNYFRHYQTQIKDQLTSLIYIQQAVEVLRQKKIPFMMTYMDDLIMKKIEPEHLWLQQTQKNLKSYLHLFEDMSFLDWSRFQDFEISSNHHPLDQAHASAAQLMLPKIEEILSHQYRCHSA